MLRARASLLASAGVYAMLSILDVESPFLLAITSFAIGICSSILWRYQIIFQTPKDRNHAFFFLLFRIANVFFVQTFFQPDEYFQAQEPALSLAFGPAKGQGGQSDHLKNLTWEWQHQLRSAAYPYLLAIAYRTVEAACDVLGLEYSTKATLLVTSPGLLQACFAASTDYYTWKLSELAYGEQSAESNATIILTLLNPWNWFVSTRTLANSVETALMTMGFAKWPWRIAQKASNSSAVARRNEKAKTSTDIDGKTEGTAAQESVIPSRGEPRFNALAIHGIGAACILRPTGALIWIPIVFNLIRTHPLSTFRSFTYHALTQAAIVLAWSAYCDYTFYGQLTFPPFQFIRLNVFLSISEFYGTNTWYYYITEGLAFLLSTTLPFAIEGLLRSPRPTPAHHSQTSSLAKSGAPDILRQLSQSVVFTIAVMSSLAHKEVRFIYPLLPLLLVISSRPAFDFISDKSDDSSCRPLLLLRRLTAFVGILATVALALYASLIHQSGVLRTMTFLRHEHQQRVGLSAGDALNQNSTYVHKNHLPVRDWKDDLTRTSIAFLTPCHSFPSRAHLIDTPPDLLLRPLTCEPPLDLQPGSLARKTYSDEADVFYQDPAAWFGEWERNLGNYSVMVEPPSAESLLPPPRQPLGFLHPDYIVMFGALADGQGGSPNMGELLRRGRGPWRWEECWRTFNSHWHDDWRRKGDVVVYCVQQPR